MSRASSPAAGPMEKVRRQLVAHGGLYRAPIIRDTLGQAELRARFPPRPPEASWPMTRLHAEQVVETLEAAGYHTRSPQQRKIRRCGVKAVLSWLADQPGESWQQRWMASGAELISGTQWVRTPMAWHAAHGRPSPTVKTLTHHGVQVLNCADVIRPDLGWLLKRRSTQFTAAMRTIRDPDGYARLDALLAARPLAAVTANACRYRITLLLAAKGGTIADITVGDCVLLQEAHGRGRTTGEDTLIYEVLREAGGLVPDAPHTIRVFGAAAGQLTVEELVDRRGVQNREIRDLLVAYLRERQPALDYSSLEDAAYILAGCFWHDLERHHPGINSLHLPAEVAAAWKRRLQTTVKVVRDPAGNLQETAVPRNGYRGVLIKVRAFYLDLAAWAVEDPARWARWVAPCPIRAADCDRSKARREHKAAIDQRTRERLPILPALVSACERYRFEAAERLAAARSLSNDELFTAGGQTLRRVVRRAEGGAKTWAADAKTGSLRDLTREDDHAFWTWAIVEVLRHTGIRIEELLELSDHGIVQYRLPSTGELVPLLQVTPSKTDAERLLLISPELADVLAAIVTRVRGSDGTIPLVASYDCLEKRWRPPLPLLFQHYLGNEHRPANRNLVTRLLGEAVYRLGATTSDGQPIDLTAHDFRRIFITDAILHGLPPHIAQMIVGHADLNTTMAYKAVYPTEAIDAHRAFLARRRSLRPSEEYRTPTEAEWEEFLGHFQRRKLSVGTCGRPYGTACQHEHACIRCPMLRPEPRQRLRLVEIRDNLIDRITEAEAEHWLGELDGLRVSLAAAEDKLSQLDRVAHRHTLRPGMPSLYDPASRNDRLRGGRVHAR
jgi:integrase